MIFQIHSYVFLPPKYTLIFKCKKNGIKFEIVSSLRGAKRRNNPEGRKLDCFAELAKRLF